MSSQPSVIKYLHSLGTITISPITMALTGLSLRVAFTFTCGISYLLYGYDQGFMSGVLIADDWLVQMNHPSTFMQGFITSIYELGCLGGKKPSPLVDLIGHKH